MIQIKDSDSSLSFRRKEPKTALILADVWTIEMIVAESESSENSVSLSEADHAHSLE